MRFVFHSAPPAQGVGGASPRHVDVPGIAGFRGDTGVVEGMRMRHGFRSALRIAATVVVVAAVARAAASARQIIDQGVADPPRHRADRTSPANPARALPRVEPVLAPPRHHAFGPELCIVPSRGAGLQVTGVTELEASGELDDDQLSATDRLFARRHAADAVKIGPD
jgi:hypothetical protein